MNKHNQNRQRRAGLLKIICGSLLVGTPFAINTCAIAEPLIRIPLNNSLLQLISHRSDVKSVLPTVTSQAPGRVVPIPPPQPPLTPPLPSEQQPPSAMITPINGLVSVILMNKTAASINYQVIGDTNERSLPGKSNYTLRDLKTPVTITFKRQDGGLLKVTPQATAEPGILLVTYTETTSLGIDRSTMRIQRNGSVFLN